MIMCAKETAGAIMSDAGMTILIGLVVVFAVLLLLTGVFKLFGIAMSKANEGEMSAARRDVSAVVPKTVPAPAVVPVVGNVAPVTTVPQVQNGIPEETVAVISAAVAMLAPAGVQYAVSGIRRAAQGNTESVTTIPGVQNGIPEEPVAAISAAVASVAPAGTQYAVKGIRRKEG